TGVVLVSGPWSSVTLRLDGFPKISTSSRGRVVTDGSRFGERADHVLAGDPHAVSDTRALATHTVRVLRERVKLTSATRGRTRCRSGAARFWPSHAVACSALLRRV